LLALPAGLEHLEHALGHDVAADRVTGAEHDADEADDLADRAVGLAEGDHGADQHDAVDEIGAGHQGGMQDHRHAGNDLVAREGRQHEDIERDESVDHDPCPPPAPSIRSRVGSWRMRPSCVSTLPANTSSSQSRASSPSLMAGERKLKRFLAYISLACRPTAAGRLRSEEHTSELQSRENLVCRLLLEKKNKRQ